VYYVLFGGVPLAGVAAVPEPRPGAAQAGYLSDATGRQ
jgi:hypothetical protein